MANNLNIDVGLKLQLNDLTTQLNNIKKQIEGKLNVDINLNVKDISTKTQKINKDIQEKMNLTPLQLRINSATGVDAINKITNEQKTIYKQMFAELDAIENKRHQRAMQQANELQAKIKQSMTQGQGQYYTREFSSVGVLGTKQSDIQNSIRSVMQAYGIAGEKINKITTQMNKDMSLSTATVQYRDATGKMIQETMKWRDVINQANGQIKRVFETTSISIVNDMKRQEQALQNNINARNRSYNALASQRKKEQDAVASFANWQKQMEGKFNTLETGRTKKFVNTAELDALKLKFNELTNAFGKMGTATPQFRQQMQALNDEFKRIKTNANEAGRAGFSLSDMMVTAWKKMVVWLGAGTVIFQALRQIQNAFTYVKDMNDAMVELAKVTEFTTKTMNDLRQSAIDTGKALGKSSADIMRSYAEIGRVYKNPEEIKELSRIAVMASNVTSLTAQEAAKSLNTTLLTFKLGVKDAANVLDQYNELQNNYRVSAEDLSASVGKVGAVAKQTNLTLAQLNALTTTVVSTSGVSGEEAGTMIKSALGRLYRIGEEGELDAGKSESELAKVGVAVRNATGEFRGAMEILTDLKAVWSSLSNVQQNNLAQTIGSLYHYSKFINIMENFDLVTKATNTALNSQNSAIIENEKYIDSISGRLQIFKTTMEDTFGKALSADFIKGVVSGLTLLANSFGFIIDKIGLFPPIITTVVLGLIAFNTELKITSMEFIKIIGLKFLDMLKQIPQAFAIAKAEGQGFIGVLKLLGIQQALVKIGAIAMNAALTLGLAIAFTYVTTKVVEWTDSLIKARENQKKFITETQNEIKTLEDQAKAVKSLKDEYESLTQKQNSVGLNVDEKQKLADVQNKLIEQFPELKNSLTGEINQQKSISEELNKKIKYLEKEYDLKQQILELEAGKELENLGEDIAKQKDFINSANNNSSFYNPFSKSGRIQNKREVINYKQKQYDEMPDTWKITKAGQEFKNELDSLNSEITKAIQEAQNNLDNNISEVLNQVNNISNKIVKTYEKTYGELTNESKDVLKSIIEDIIKINPEEFTGASGKSNVKKVLDIVLPKITGSDISNKKKEYDEALKSFSTLPNSVNEQNLSSIANTYRTSLYTIGESAIQNKEALTQFKNEVDSIVKLPKDIKIDFKSNVENSLKLIEKFNEELVQMGKDNKSLIESAMKLNTLDKASKEYYDTTIQIAEKYPELISGVDKATGAFQFQGDIVDILKTKSQEEFDAKKKQTLDKFELTKANLERLKTEAQKEIDTNQTLIESDKAKLKSTQNKFDYLKNIVSKLPGVGAYIAQAIGKIEDVAVQPYLDGIDAATNLNNSAKDKLKDIMKDASFINEAEKKLNGLSKFTNNITPYSGSDFEKKDKSSPADKNAEKYKNEKDDLMGYKQALADVNDEIANNQALQKKANDSERIDLLKQEIDLLQKKWQKTNDLAFKEDELAKVERKKLEDKGLQFDENGLFNPDQYDQIINKKVAVINAINEDTDERKALIMDLENFKAAKEKYIQLRTDYKKDMIELNNLSGDKFGKSNELAKAKTDQIFKQQEESITPLQQSLDKLKASYEGLSEDNFADKLSNINQQMEAQTKLVKEYDKQIADLGVAWNATNSPEERDRLHKEADKLRDAKIGLEKSNNELGKTKISTQIDVLFDKSTKSAEAYAQAIDNLDFKEYMLAENDLNGQLKVKEERVQLATKELKLQTQELNKLNAVTDKAIVNDKDFIAGKEKLESAMRDNIKIIRDTEKAMAETKIKAIEDTEQKIQDIIKKSIEKKKEFLDEELDSYKEFVDAKLKAKEDEYKSEDYEKDLEEELKKRQEIQDKINVLSLDKTYSSFQKKKELQKDFDEQNKKVEELQRNRRRDLEKDALQDSLKQKEDSVEDTKKLLDDTWTDEKIRVEAHEATINKSFDSIRKQFPELFKQLGVESTNFFDTFKTYLQKFEEGVGDMATTIDTEWLPKIKEAVNSAKDLNKLKTIVDNPNVATDDTTKPSNNAIQNATESIDVSNIQQAKQFESSMESDALKKNRDRQLIGYYQRQWNSYDQQKGIIDPKVVEDKQKYYETEAQKIRDARKWSFQDYSNMPDFLIKDVIGTRANGINDGEIPKTGSYLLHKGELVIRQDQMANFIKNLANRVLPEVNIKPPKLSAMGGYGDINLNINIENGNDPSVVEKVKDVGKSILQDIKKTLNKNGIYR